MEMPSIENRSNLAAESPPLLPKPVAGSVVREISLGPEQAAALRPDHGVDAEPMRPDFALRFDGILPLRANEKRRMKRRSRESLLRGMLRHLKQGEWLAFHMGCKKEGGFSWHILGGANRETEPGRGVGRDLSALVNTALGGLRREYRFSRMGVDHQREPRAWHARVGPIAQSLSVVSHGMGFGTLSVGEDMQLKVPNPWIGRGDRIFSSLVQLVMSAPSPMEMVVRCGATLLNKGERQQIAASLETLRRAPAPPASRDHHLATCALLETWLHEGYGARMECVFTADQALPDQFLELAGSEIYGCPVMRHPEAPPPSSVLDLSQSLPLSLQLPMLLPSAESLDEVRPPRVFNVNLPRIPQHGPQLGTATSGTGTVRVALSEEGRSRHTYAVGATGVGKSTLLANLLRQDIAAGHGVALIDPHGDLFEHVLATMPARRAQDVVLIEPASSECVPGINFLDIPEGPMRRLQVNFVVTELLGIFDELYDMRQCGGPIFELYFRNSVLLLLESRCPGATLLDLARVFNDKEFRKELCEHCDDKQVVNFWTQTAERTNGDASLSNLTPYITSKLNQLTQSGPIRPIIGQARTTVDFRKLMDNRGILLVNLSKGLLGEMDTRMLGMVLIGQLFSAALGRAALPPNQRVCLHLYVDEFQNFVTDSIAALIAEARKFGLSLTLANQTLAQLSGNRGHQNLLEAILGNVGNMIAFRLGVPDAERLALFTEPDLPREELQRLPNYHAFARLLTSEGPVDPFVFKSDPPAKPSRHGKRVLAKIRKNQAQWSHPLEKVERDIAQRLGSSRWQEPQQL